MRFSYLIAWLVETKVKGVVIISSLFFHLLACFNILTAKCNPTVLESKFGELIKSYYIDAPCPYGDGKSSFKIKDIV